MTDKRFGFPTEATRRADRYERQARRKTRAGVAEELGLAPMVLGWADGPFPDPFLATGPGETLPFVRTEGVVALEAALQRRVDRDRMVGARLRRGSTLEEVAELTGLGVDAHQHYEDDPWPSWGRDSSEFALCSSAVFLLAPEREPSPSDIDQADDRMTWAMCGVAHRRRLLVGMTRAGVGLRSGIDDTDVARYELLGPAAEPELAAAQRIARAVKSVLNFELIDVATGEPVPPPVPPAPPPGTVHSFAAASNRRAGHTSKP